MKQVILGSIAAVFLISLLGCQPDTTQSDQLTGSEDRNGFVDLEPSEWVKYIKPVTEYMYYRTQAVVNNDINILWNMYPDLKGNMDLKQGINVEKMEVESLNQHFDLLDANYNLESNERIKVKTINDIQGIVLVHGSTTYLRNDFDLSGGEYLIELHIEQIDNRWKVIKTDEYTLPEYKDWLKEKENH